MAAMDPQERADRAAAAMFTNDKASPWMGMAPPEVRPGWARMSLTVVPHHCNGHYICHGAVIFGLVQNAVFFIPWLDGSYYRVFLGTVLLIAAFANESIRKRITGGI